MFSEDELKASEDDLKSSKLKITKKEKTTSKDNEVHPKKMQDN